MKKMNEINKNTSPPTIDSNQNNLNDTRSESTMNMSQNEIINLKNKEQNKPHANRAQTPSTIRKTKKIIKKDKDNSAKSLSFLKTNLKKSREKLRFTRIKIIPVRYISQLKKKNNTKFMQTKKNQNKINSETKKIRSKSFKARFSSLYSSFNKIFMDFNPVTAIIYNIPKNLKIDFVYQKISSRVGGEFIYFKYNKKNGHLYIKFRNIFYYNYYYFYMKGRHFLPNCKELKMTKIEEANEMWKALKEEEILMTFEQENNNNNFYDFISKNFKSIPLK
jgi:hypothetical protein